MKYQEAETQYTTLLIAYLKHEGHLNVTEIQFVLHRINITSPSTILRDIVNVDSRNWHEVGSAFKTGLIKTIFFKYP
jgi:hypothetical protein